MDWILCKDRMPEANVRVNILLIRTIDKEVMKAYGKDFEIYFKSNHIPFQIEANWSSVYNRWDIFNWNSIGLAYGPLEPSYKVVAWQPKCKNLTLDEIFKHYPITEFVIE